MAGAGARVDGRIVEADKGGRLKGKASLMTELTSLTTSDGQRIEIVTSPLGAEAAANKGKDAAKVGVGAGAVPSPVAEKVPPSVRWSAGARARRCVATRPRFRRRP